MGRRGLTFRARLTTFFVLLVVLPMVALGVVVTRLVADSEAGKLDARIAAYGAAAMRFYERSAALGARAAGRLGSDRALVAAIRARERAAVERRARALMRAHGLARVVVVIGRDTAVAAGRPFLDVGGAAAVAAGSATIRGRAGRPRATIQASTIDAATFVHALGGPGIALVVRRGTTVLASSLPGPLAAARNLPARGETTHRGVDYVLTSFRADALDGSRERVTVLADASGTGAESAHNRRIAFALLAGFLLIALVGALLVSRQLQRQIGRFLAAARRLAGGDFSTPVPTHGRDEFAQLGREFNKMSAELERRIEELHRERTRLRDSIRRVGETFASNLDRRALLELGVETAVAAVEADGGRATAAAGDAAADRASVAAELARVGDVAALAPILADAEARARATGAPASATAADGEAAALACPLPRAQDGAPPHGTVAVARRGRRFDAEERTLLASLAAQTAISLENVELHDRVRRQAVTDEMTGLSNHRRFQEVMGAEVAAARRYGQPLGLVLLDVDDFKRVNDTYGHQQGDLVLKAVARVLLETSREIDEPARYGGEEMAIVLPRTDLEGTYAIAERVRTAVEALAVPLLERDGVLRVTVSCGVAASAAACKERLIASADAALYAAKRGGKNRTVRGTDPAELALEAD